MNHHWMKDRFLNLRREDTVLNRLMNSVDNWGRELDGTAFWKPTDTVDALMNRVDAERVRRATLYGWQCKPWDDLSEVERVAANYADKPQEAPPAKEAFKFPSDMWEFLKPLGDRLAKRALEQALKPNPFMPRHECEDWMMQEGPHGPYCAACGKIRPDYTPKDELFVQYHHGVPQGHVYLMPEPVEFAPLKPEEPLGHVHVVTEDEAAESLAELLRRELESDSWDVTDLRNVPIEGTFDLIDLARTILKAFDDD